jgi:DNA-binding transcriptional MerR regulator
MLISELAEKVGLHPETIRRLEKRGLIAAVRDVNGWRRYPPETVNKLRTLYAKDHSERSK